MTFAFICWSRSLKSLNSCSTKNEVLHRQNIPQAVTKRAVEQILPFLTGGKAADGRQPLGVISSVPPPTMQPCHVTRIFLPK